MYCSAEEQLYGAASSDTRSISAGPGWLLAQWLRGSGGHGQGRYVANDGSHALVTFTLLQTVPARELEARLRHTTPGVTPLLAIDVVDERSVMIEVEPDGIPLSTPMFPMAPEDALGVLGGILEIVAQAHAKGELLGGIRPELVYVGGPGRDVSGLAPRAEVFASTMRESRDLAPPYPFDALYAAPERVAGGPDTAASDVYAACATFLFALTRRPPFLREGDSSNIIQQLVAMRAHDAEVPSSVTAVSKEVASAIQAGLRRRPESRPTAQAILDVLREHRDEDPNQRAEFERELALFERTRGIKPIDT